MDDLLHSLGMPRQGSTRDQLPKEGATDTRAMESAAFGQAFDAAEDHGSMGSNAGSNSAPLSDPRGPVAGQDQTSPLPDGTTAEPAEGAIPDPAFEESTIEAQLQGAEATDIAAHLSPVPSLRGRTSGQPSPSPSGPAHSVSLHALHGPLGLPASGSALQPSPAQAGTQLPSSAGGSSMGEPAQGRRPPQPSVAVTPPATQAGTALPPIAYRTGAEIVAPPPNSQGTTITSAGQPQTGPSGAKADLPIGMLAEGASTRTGAAQISQAPSLPMPPSAPPGATGLPSGAAPLAAAGAAASLSSIQAGSFGATAQAPLAGSGDSMATAALQHVTATVTPVQQALPAQHPLSPAGLVDEEADGEAERPARLGPTRDAPYRTGAWQTVSTAQTPADTAGVTQLSTSPPPSVTASTTLDGALLPLDGLDIGLQTAALSGTPLTALSPSMAPQAPVAYAHAIAHQIARTLAEPGREPGGMVELALDPPELGRLRMQMGDVAGVLTLTITAERPETADLMRRHLELLAQEFAQAGLDAPNVQISHGDSGSDGQTAQGDPADTQSSDGPGLPDITPLSGALSRSASGALDLRL